MDPSPPSSDLATQMGFASFGAQPTAKKRKYNSAAEAVISCSPPASLPRKHPPSKHGTSSVQKGDGLGSHRRGGGRKQVRGMGGNVGRNRGGWMGGRGDGMSGSGSNKTPLGARVKTEGGAGVSGHAEQDQGVSPRYGGVRMSGGNPGDEKGMPGYVDDTPPDSPMHSGGVKLSERVGKVAERDTAVIEGLAEDEGLSPQAEEPARVLQDPEPPQDNLPLRNQQNSTERARYDWAALRRGVRNEMGDMVYYDASFVEDPWAELRAAGNMGQGV